MKNIVIPENVKFTENIEISFKDWLTENVLVDAKFGKNMKMIYKGLDMKQSLETLVSDTDPDAGKTWPVGEENYEILKDVVENPSVPMNPAAMYKLISFVEAITKAE